MLEVFPSLEGGGLFGCSRIKGCGSPLRHLDLANSGACCAGYPPGCHPMQLWRALDGHLQGSGFSARRFQASDSSCSSWVENGNESFGGDVFSVGTLKRMGSADGVFSVVSATKNKSVICSASSGRSDVVDVFPGREFGHPEF